MCSSWLLAQTPSAGGHWDSCYAIHYNGTLNPGIRCGDLGLQQGTPFQTGLLCKCQLCGQMDWKHLHSFGERRATGQHFAAFHCSPQALIGCSHFLFLLKFNSHSCTTVCFFIKLDLNCEELCSLLSVHADQ